MNKYELTCYEESKNLLALEVGEEISEENADALIKQYEGHKYLSVYIQKNDFASKIRNKDVMILYAYARYPWCIIKTDNMLSSKSNSKLEYELIHYNPHEISNRRQGKAAYRL